VLNWSSMRPDEQLVLRDCARQAALRGTGALVGGALLSSLVLYGLPWRARTGSTRFFQDSWRARVPAWLRVLAIVATAGVSGYAGALSTVPSCLERILRLPNSHLAAEVRLSIEDWQTHWSQRVLDLKPLQPAAEPEQHPVRRASAETAPRDSGQAPVSCRTRGTAPRDSGAALPRKHVIRLWNRFFHQRLP